MIGVPGAPSAAAAWRLLESFVGERSGAKVSIIVSREASFHHGSAGETYKKLYTRRSRYSPVVATDSSSDHSRHKYPLVPLSPGRRQTAKPPRRQKETSWKIMRLLSLPTFLSTPLQPVPTSAASHPLAGAHALASARDRGVRREEDLVEFRFP